MGLHLNGGWCQKLQLASLCNRLEARTEVQAAGAGAADLLGSV